MTKRFTLSFLDLILKNESSISEKSLNRIFPEEELKPKEKTIRDILSYSSSVRGIRMKSDKKILISLN